MNSNSSEGSPDIESLSKGILESNASENRICDAMPMLESQPGLGFQLMSRRDRRKQFDMTTPTLVDEEDIPEEFLWEIEEAGSSAVGGEPMQTHNAGAGSIADTALRPTAGFNVCCCVSDEQIRKTTGTESIQETAYVSLISSLAQKHDDAGLGVGFSLADQVAPTGQIDCSVPDSPSRSVQAAINSIPDQLESQEYTQKAPPSGRRQGSFSPALLRLTENIGNLLHEDEDDEYAGEIPGVLRAETARPGDGLQPMDSVACFAFDSNADFVRKTTASGVIMPSVKGRRKQEDVLQLQTHSQLSQRTMTQRPIARERMNEVFMFGSRHQNESHQPSQFIHFGGAFAPLTHSGASTSPSFATSSHGHDTMRQRAASSQKQDSEVAIGSSTPSQPETQEEIKHYHHHEASTTVPIDRGLLSAPSHDTILPTRLETPIDAFFNSHRSSPTNSSATFFPQSDIMATAHNYYPMTVSQAWSLQSPPPSFSTHRPYYNAVGDIQTWQSDAHAYSMSQGGTRPSMTPLPQMPKFQQQDPRHYLPGSQASQIFSAAPMENNYHQQQNSYSIESRSAWEKRDTKKGKRGKKKASKDSSRPKQQAIKMSHRIKKESENHAQEASEKARNNEIKETASSTEFLIDPKRTELDESPDVRLAFKNFYKLYRAEEQKGVQFAEEFAKNALIDKGLPTNVHWRVYIELADLARRTNRFAEARQYYKRVCVSQPYASQGWVEYSKLEEECGNMNRVTNIMYLGLEYCEFNENLMIRAIKHLEKMGKHRSVRALLAKLKHVEIDKIWRTLLEGALFEARVGNVTAARRALKYVMHFVPWYGPLYVEYYRLERDQGYILDALEVVERGLAQIPRYGPLWFSALRVCEELDHADLKYDLPRVTSVLQKASAYVSKEIIWKIYLEAAFSFERAAITESEHVGLPIEKFLSAARYYFALTIQVCHLNLRWKVWLAGARMELCAGNVSMAIQLYRRAHQVAPDKVRPLTLLDYARLYQFTGDRDLARAILYKARVEYRHDWKVWLESVLLEMRGSDINAAFEVARAGLEAHSGTGRLWSAFVQLSRFKFGAEAQLNALRTALNAVPKSGEVWCEGARIHLNPFSDIFDIERARRHLFFAERFTPQYGDSFLESVRLALIKDWLIPIADMIWNQTKASFFPKQDEDAICSFTKYITDVSLVLTIACRKVDIDVCRSHNSIIEQVQKRICSMPSLNKANLSRIILACTNADPNYGPLWFHCRRYPNDSPRQVIERAMSVMLMEIRSFAHLYIAAQIRRLAILSTVNYEPPTDSQDRLEIFDVDAIEHEERMDALLRFYPSLRDFYNPFDAMTGLELLPGALDGFDFVTGLMEYNRQCPLEQMSMTERRQTIFATDALFP